VSRTLGTPKRLFRTAQCMANSEIAYHIACYKTSNYLDGNSSDLTTSTLARNRVQFFKSIRLITKPRHSVECGTVRFVTSLCNQLQLIDIVSSIRRDGVVISRCVVHTAKRDIRAAISQQLLPIYCGVNGPGSDSLVILGVGPINQRCPS
jgi:hypothetical protein